ncbi:MAG: response regulator [Verrucomicrobiales bacterium]|nr:response regulator [Verrucomicrobiales bacterium]MDB6129805.1 response regulator [Verrucomicrobiales bacterium]
MEDNDDDVLIFKRALAKTGIGNEFHRLKNGQEALDFFGKNVEPENLPVVCFLDWHLPMKSGLEVLQFLNSKNLQVTFPVIVLTNQQDLKAIKESYVLGAHSFLTKPLDVEQLSNLTVNSRLIARQEMPNGTFLLLNR